MEQIVLIIHLAIALAIIGLIMLQQGKGADMGASFGAGASQTLFGSDGSGNVLSRATAYLVAVFFATSFGLAMIATQKSAPVDELEGLDTIEETVDVAPADIEDIPAVDGAKIEQAVSSDLPVVGEDIPTVDTPKEVETVQEAGAAKKPE